MLEGPFYICGCKHLYQDKVFQPRNRPNQAFIGSKGNESHNTNATFKIILVLNRPLLHSRGEASPPHRSRRPSCPCLGSRNPRSPPSGITNPAGVRSRGGVGGRGGGRSRDSKMAPTPSRNGSNAESRTEFGPTFVNRAGTCRL
jgi:hypothetical protein